MQFDKGMSIRPVFSRHGNRRLGAVLRQRIQASSLSASEHQSDDVFHARSLQAAKVKSSVADLYKCNGEPGTGKGRGGRGTGSRLALPVLSIARIKGGIVSLCPFFSCPRSTPRRGGTRHRWPFLRHNLLGRFVCRHMAYDIARKTTVIRDNIVHSISTIAFDLNGGRPTEGRRRRWRFGRCCQHRNRTPPPVGRCNH